MSAIAQAQVVLSQLRVAEIVGHLLAVHGPVIQAGPFAGMRFPVPHPASAYLPKLFGCYEQELHPAIDSITGCDYVVNVGCGEGYYAVGLARRGWRVVAIDTDPTALEACRANAAANDALVECHDRWHPIHCRPPRALILCDVEGAEEELLSPPWSDLATHTLLVECHEFLRPGVTDRLAAAYADTHTAERIPHALRIPGTIPLMGRLGQMDQLLCVWEGRPGPTPWLLVRPRVGESVGR